MIDVIIAKIRQPNEKDIIVKFQYKEFDVIGAPRKRRLENALKIKSVFGEGKQDRLEW